MERDSSCGAEFIKGQTRTLRSGPVLQVSSSGERDGVVIDRYDTTGVSIEERLEAYAAVLAVTLVLARSDPAVSIAAVRRRAAELSKFEEDGDVSG